MYHIFYRLSIKIYRLLLFCNRIHKTKRSGLSRPLVVLQLRAALADKDCVLANHHNIFPTNSYFLTPAKEAPYTPTAENGYTHKATGARIYFHIAYATKAAAVINVNYLL